MCVMAKVAFAFELATNTELNKQGIKKSKTSIILLGTK